MKALLVKSTGQHPSEWVSPPKGGIYNGNTDETTPFIGGDRQIQAGRLCIRCAETSNIRRKDQTQSKTKLNMYLSFVLGPNSGRPIKRSTQPKDHATNETSTLAGDTISFDIEDPSHLLGGEDDDIKLKIELLDKTPIVVDILGEVIISAARFLVANKQSIEWIPLYQPGDKSSNSAINLQFSYMPVKQGVLILSILECKDMNDLEIGKLPEQACVDFSVGNNRATQGIKARNVSGKLMFDSDTITYTNIDKDNWFCDLKLQCHNVIDDIEHHIIGEGEISILPLVSNNKNDVSDVINVNLVNYPHREEQEATVMGCLVMRWIFVEAGKLTIKVISGHRLTREQGSPKKMNPYVVLKLKGKASSMEKKTKPLTEGGGNPIWDENITFIVVDHHTVELECYDYDPLTSDCDLIGTSCLSLLPVLQEYRQEAWVNLCIKNQASQRSDTL